MKKIRIFQACHSKTRNNTITRNKIGPRKDTPKMLGKNVKATMESRLTNSRVNSFSLDRSDLLESGSLTVTIGQESPFVQDAKSINSLQIAMIP